MGGKHKKNLRAEKAKVKLKGAKLPKGLNVTKTEFKVRKIVLKEQLQDDFEDGKRINVKETIGKLKHHNTSMRMDALKQCKGIIENKTQDLSRNLGELIQGIANIILDIESEPRKEALKQLSELLSSVSSETAEPFFNVLCSYLRCGMTHIQPAIQRDSLLLLDSLITHLPALIASRSNIILTDFLDMISKSKFGSSSSRMLTTNVESKTTNLRWRTDVLLRLHLMLSTVIEFRFKEKSIFNQELEKGNVRYNINKPNYFPLKSKSSNTANGIALFCNASNFEVSDDYNKYKMFISQLVPLLFETWLEVSPLSKSERALKEDISLTHESALSLKIILEIISKIWIIIKLLDNEMRNCDLSNWFSQTYCNDFKNYFLDPFPYKQLISNLPRKKAKDKQENSGGIECYPQNFQICNLYCKFFKHRINQEPFNKTMLDYVISSMENSSSSINFYDLEQVLNQIFLENIVFFEHFQNEVQVLLTIVIKKLSDTTFFTLDSNNDILIMLGKMISRSSNLYNWNKDALIESWLKTLSSLLLKPNVSYGCLLTLAQFAKQQNSTFLLSLKENVDGIIDNIGNIQIIGSENQFEGKKLIMQLFYWLIFDEEQKLNLIKRLDCSGIKDKRIVPYFKSILLLNKT